MLAGVTSFSLPDVDRLHLATTYVFQLHTGGSANRLDQNPFGLLSSVRLCDSQPWNLTLTADGDFIALRDVSCVSQHLLQRLHKRLLRAGGLHTST